MICYLKVIVIYLRNRGEGNYEIILLICEFINIKI